MSRCVFPFPIWLFAVAGLPLLYLQGYSSVPVYDCYATACLTFLATCLLVRRWPRLVGLEADRAPGLPRPLPPEPPAEPRLLSLREAIAELQVRRSRQPATPLRLYREND